MRPGRLLPRPDDDPLARCAFGRHSSLAWPSADEPLSPIDLLWSGQLASLPALRTFRRRLAHCQASNHIPFPDRFSTPASLRRTPVVHSLTTSSFNIGSNRSRYARWPGEMDWPYAGHRSTPTNYGYPGYEGYGPAGAAYPDDRFYPGGARAGAGWDPQLDYDYVVPPVGWAPQRDWRGYEFASAQGRGMGRGLYDDVAGRLGGYYDDYRSDEMFARAAHRLVYGEGELFRAHARELGAAAAFEAFLMWERAASSGRGWSHGGRGLEGLVGLAIGEAWNLVVDVGADRDPRREERIMRTAAATARALYNSQWDRVDDDRYLEPAYGSVPSARFIEYGAPARSRRGRLASFSSDGGGGGALVRRRSFDDGYYGGRSTLAIGGPSYGSGAYYDDRGRYGY